MELGTRIKQRRLDLGLTLEDLGAKVGVAKATVHRWESGEIENIRIDKLLPLADALETSPAFLLGTSSDSDGDAFIDCVVDMAISEHQVKIREMAHAEKKLVETARRICDIPYDAAFWEWGKILCPERLGVVAGFINDNEKTLRILIEAKCGESSTANMEDDPLK